MSSELKDSMETYHSLKEICLQNELTEIIKYRDKLAHGKRFHEKLRPTKLEYVLLTLENILDEI